mmetsp:Transcript_6425/g.17315  ORF Transcript_6425/g.17315 Transcript_6425/m.17315 type:complete len:277 (-) Transcript_6425:1049-1879(-)
MDIEAAACLGVSLHDVAQAAARGGVLQGDDSGQHHPKCQRRAKPGPVGKPVGRIEHRSVGKAARAACAEPNILTNAFPDFADIAIEIQVGPADGAVVTGVGRAAVEARLLAIPVIVPVRPCALEAVLVDDVDPRVRLAEPRISRPITWNHVRACNRRRHTIPRVARVDVRDDNAIQSDLAVCHPDRLPHVGPAEDKTPPSRALRTPWPRSADMVGRGHTWRNAFAVVLPVRTDGQCHLRLHPLLIAAHAANLRQACPGGPEGGSQQEVRIRRLVLR